MATPRASARAETNSIEAHPAKEKLRALIEALGGRHIDFVPAYADIRGLNVNAAVLLSQMVYWSGRGRLEDNWCYKSRQEWVSETRLTFRELDTARSALENVGILQERLGGIPAKLYWRLDFDRLADLLLVSSDADKNKLRGKRKAGNGEALRKTRTNACGKRQVSKEHRLLTEITKAKHGTAEAVRKCNPPLSATDFRWAVGILNDAGIEWRDKRRDHACIRAMWSATSGPNSQRRQQFSDAALEAANFSDRACTIFALGLAILRGEDFPGRMTGAAVPIGPPISDRENTGNRQVGELA